MTPDQTITHTITIESVEYSSSTTPSVTTFNVNIKANCVITALSAPTLPTSTVKYIWGSNAVADTLVIPAWTQTPCSYPETRTFVPDLSGYDWISYTSGDLTVSVIKNDGTEEVLSQEITVQITLPDDPNSNQDLTSYKFTAVI